MKTLFLLTITTGLAISILTGCAEAPAGNIPPIHGTGWMLPKKTLRPFRSEQELKTYLKELAEKQRLERQRLVARPAEAPSVANSSIAGLAKGDSTEKSKESITNVQHAGVDEGGIVKLHGRHLVVLSITNLSFILRSI